jgi:hypothetical protein
MTTPSRRAFVSIAAALTITLALGACVRTPSRAVLHRQLTTDVHPLAIRFDNNAREHVHVYLLGARRQWLLGRVEPGGIAILQLPEESLIESANFARLAVLTGERVTLQAARHPRATLTIAQPASAILSQRWKFAQGELTSLGR